MSDDHAAGGPADPPVPSQPGAAASDAPSCEPTSSLDPRDGNYPADHASCEKLAPGLYLVSTPIGNLADLSPRGLATLRLADEVLCEDSRITGRLLHRHGIARSLLPYHEHNAARMRPQILRRLAAGAAVALASDAGTPLISDPGYKLVQAAIAAAHPVLAVPGPSAALAALTVSGLPTDRFMVAGFLPPRGGARERALAELRPVPATLVLFEAARRLPRALTELAAAFGPREAAVARELTKRFEEVRRGTLAELAAHYAAAGAPRGEVVIVIGPPAAAAEAATADLDATLQAALAGQPPAAAAAQVAAQLGLPKRQVYRRALALKAGAPGDGETDA